MADPFACTLPIDADFEYHEVGIKKVEANTDGFTLHRDDGWSMSIPNAGFTPMAGQVARFYGRGIGYIVRGVTINGQVAFYRTLAEQKVLDDEAAREHAAWRAAAMAETKIPDVVTPGFEWTEDMAEVSGAGGGYERACRQMISQGCAWWSEHSDADPKFSGFKGVYGLCMDDNDDAKALSAAVAEGVDPTGAMHQAAIAHVFQWRRLGSWIAYQATMQDLARTRAAEGDQ